MASLLLACHHLALRPVRAASLGRRGLAATVRCQTQPSDIDRHYMRRCVELARKATGHTSPNPMVGCVIVRDGQVVGEGFHPKAGQPHAKVSLYSDNLDICGESRRTA